LTNWADLSMEIGVYNKEGHKIEDMQLNGGKLDGPIRFRLMRDAVIMYEANKRQGTASTKTKAEVAGGGKKPWAQKHTGRARAGSNRSPIWKGGGVALGPKPRDYSYTMPKKAKKLALYSALAAKMRDNEVIVIDELDFDSPKTKQMVFVLKSLGVLGDSCLVVLSDVNDPVLKSARNIPTVKTMKYSDLNAYEVLRPKKILITKQALVNLI